MIEFLLWAGGVSLLVIVASALAGWYKLRTDTRFRIFFDMTNEDNGMKISMNMLVFGDTKQEAERRLREIIKRQGNYTLIIYESTKDEPDHNLTEL